MSSPIRHIVVAEDNLAMADVVRFNLQNAGYRVSLCRNGRDALELLQAGGVDAVITDYQMPGLDGEELCRHIRDDARLAGIPVIMVSAKGLELDIDRMREELRLRSILYKPFSPRELTRLVAETLDTLAPTA